MSLPVLLFQPRPEKCRIYAAFFGITGIMDPTAGNSQIFFSLCEGMVDLIAVGHEDSAVVVQELPGVLTAAPVAVLIEIDRRAAIIFMRVVHPHVALMFRAGIRPGRVNQFERCLIAVNQLALEISRCIRS